MVSLMRLHDYLRVNLAHMHSKHSGNESFSEIDYLKGRTVKLLVSQNL